MCKNFENLLLTIWGMNSNSQILILDTNGTSSSRIMLELTRYRVDSFQRRVNPVESLPKNLKIEKKKKKRNNLVVLKWLGNRLSVKSCLAPYSIAHASHVTALQRPSYALKHGGVAHSPASTVLPC